MGFRTLESLYKFKVIFKHYFYIHVNGDGEPQCLNG